jgi:hypothetical protein
MLGSLHRPTSPNKPSMPYPTLYKRKAPALTLRSLVNKAGYTIVPLNLIGTSSHPQTRLKHTNMTAETGIGHDQQGKWVCTHQPANHKDTFIKKRRSEHDPPPSKQARTPVSQGAETSPLNAAHLAQLAQAHAQLTALLASGATLLPTDSAQHQPTPQSNETDLLDIDNW